VSPPLGARARPTGRASLPIPSGGAFRSWGCFPTKHFAPAQRLPAVQTPQDRLEAVFPDGEVGFSKVRSARY